MRSLSLPLRAARSTDHARRSLRRGRAPAAVTLLTATLALAACSRGSTGGGGTRSKAITAPAPRRFVTVTLPGTAPMGWLAVAPVFGENEAAPGWLPADDSAALLLLPEGTPEPPLGTEVLAVPMRGAAQRLAIGERRKVRYGCDNNQLEGIALYATQSAAPVPASGAGQADDGATTAVGDGPAIDGAPPPGPVWVLPNTADAATWKPSGLPVVQVERKPDRRIWTVGWLRFALVTRDRSHATFSAARGDAWLMHRELERPLMEGAEDVAIDLTQEVPGMPQLAGAFSLVPDGPILLVVATPGYEGTQLTTLLYDGVGLREVETMQRYLYACAF